MVYVVKAVDVANSDTETTISTAMGVSWSEECNDAGYGQVSFPYDAPGADVARVPLNEVRIYEPDGTLRFAFVVQTFDTVLVSSAEEAGQVITVAGPGMGARLARAVVFPEYGLDRPSSYDRLFGLMTNDMNGPDQGAIEPFPFGRQDAPGAKITANLSGFPAEWPDPGAVWLGPTDTTGAGTALDPYLHAAGTWYLRREIITVEDFGACRIYAALDSRGTVWFDGVPVIQTDDSSNFRKGLTADITVNTGTHNIAARIVNNANPNPEAANFALALITIVTLDANGEPDGVIYRTFNSVGTTTWQAFDFGTVPGLNAGIIMNILLGESDARSTSTVDAVDYDATQAGNGDEASATDTAGDVWTAEVNNFGWSVGTDLLTVLDGLVDLCGIDWHVAPDRTLSMWQNGRGVDRGLTPAGPATTVTLQQGVSIINYTIDRDAPRSNVHVVRSASTLTVATDTTSVATFGRLESLLDVGTTVDGTNEAGTAVAAAFEATAGTVSTAVAELAPVAGATPYADFDVGDIIVAPDELGFDEDWRVKLISVRQDDDNGLPVFTVELVDPTDVDA